MCHGKFFYAKFCTSYYYYCYLNFKSSYSRINPLVTVPWAPVYNWYKCHFHIPQFFQFPGKIQMIIFLFAFFQFYSVISWDSKFHNFASSPFCWLLQGVVVWPRISDLFAPQNYYYYYYYYLLPKSFSYLRQLMVFYWSLSDSKFLKVSRNLLSILSVLNNVVVWMVSTRPLISKSFSPFNSPLVTVPKTPITIV